MKQDLQEQWFVFSVKEQSYVPLTSRNISSAQSASFFLNTVTNKNRRLNLCVDQGTSIHINGGLIDYFERTSCKQYSIDSLGKVYNRDSLFVTVYNSNLNFDHYQFYFTLIHHEPLEAPTQETQSKSYEIFPRSTSPLRNFFVFGMVFILLSLSALKLKFPKLFNEYYSFTRIFNWRIREGESVNMGIFKQRNSLFLMVHSSLVSYIFILFANFSPTPTTYIITVDYESFGMLLLYWLGFSIGVFISLFLKYSLIRVISILFKLSFIKDIHFVDFVRIAMIFYAILFASVIISGLALETWEGAHWVIMSNAVAVFLVVRFFLIMFKLLNSLSFRKLHLFSYLCTTEIIPLIISLKIYLK
ncbi:MAG: DUF4271 domain-containing protein [Bacteroidetes bacterium]|nr:DUF4271 domain-containing protein [Bacteroidota bacterium]